MKKLLVISLLFAGIGFGQTVNDAVRLALPGFGSGARAMGMGNAFVAMSDDGLGMNYNPAGIALVRRFELGGGFKYSNVQNNSTFFGNQLQAGNTSANLDNFSLLFPIPTLRGSLVIGTSYNSQHDFTGKMDFNGYNRGSSSMIQDLNGYSEIPFELYLTDDDYNTKINGRLNQAGSRLQSGSTGVWNFSVGYEAYKNLFLGLTLGLGNGSYENNYDYHETDPLGVYTGTELAPGNSFTNDFRRFSYKTLLNWDISFYEVKLGMLYQVKDLARVGLTIELPRTFTIKERYGIEAASYWGSGREVSIDPEDYKSSVEYEISTPFKFTGGVSFNVRGLILSAQASFMDYSQAKFKDISGLGGSFVGDLNKDVQSSLRAVLNYNFGAEYTVPFVDARVRAGYFTQKSPYKDDPSDYDKKFVTFGLGYLLDGELSFDVAYMYGWWKDFGENYGFAESRTLQDITLHSAVFGVSFRF